MNIRRKLILSIAALALVAAPFVPFSPLKVEKAQAAQTVMCAPNVVDSAANRVIGPGISGTGSPSAVPSGTTYTLNGQGCTVVKQADVGYFLSLGFSAGPPFGANILTTTGTLSGTTDVLVGTLPPGTYIQHIIVQNTTATAVSGGIAFGTTANGTDIVTALTCGASCLAFVADSSLSKRVFSATAAQAIHAAAVTTWQGANVTITVVYGYF